MTTYAKGDKIRVKMTVDVGLSTNSETSIYRGQIMYSTTQVKESQTSGYSTRWTHFLFTNSDRVTVPGGTERPEEGGVGVAEFDARITGDLQDRPINTTEVTEDRPDGSFGYTHFVYLQSDSITKLENADGTPLLPEELPEPEQVAPALYAKGDKIRVTIVGGRLGESMSTRRDYAGMYLIDSTVMVTAGSALHYLYRYGSGIAVTGDVVDANFTATVGDTDGPDGTTQVKDDLGYVHYMLLQSANVTKVEPEPAAIVDAVAFESKIGVVPDGMLIQSYVAPVADDERISSIDMAIESSDVRLRITELEGRPRVVTSAVVRRNPRPGQDRVLGSFAAIVDAVAFIDNNDYDKTRVGVEITSGGDNEADRLELERLRLLNDAGMSVFGDVQWTTGGVRLYESDFFDSDWARSQAQEELNLADSSDLDSWPLSLIDWDRAAEYRRDLDYSRVVFDGVNYYGSN